MSPDSDPDLSRFVGLFPNRRVVVLGDVILDHYIRGSVSRTSPEAPVPILAVESESWLPGGAANVARNLASLGASACLIGIRGDDEAGATLTRLLGETSGINPRIITDASRPTILKSRCVAQGQQMLRLDRESTRPVSDAVAAQVLAEVNQALADADGLILSDYGKGLLTPAFLQAVIEAARRSAIPVFVDPKGLDYTRYRGANFLTPNQKEAQEASGVRIEDDASLAAAAAAIQVQVQGDGLFITRGAKGVACFPKAGPAEHHPARAREVFDVTGAGDTFIAVSSMALLSGATMGQAARLGNAAAGIVVGRVGVATVNPGELTMALASERGTASKLRTLPELLAVAESLRRSGRRLVFTNGCFDLMHAGHFALLSRARELGDTLVVALNSDASVRRLKGAPRPVFELAERVGILAVLPFVDHLVVFDEDTPESLLRALKPEILVKGGASEADRLEVVGREFVESYGGQVVVLPQTNGITTADVVTRVVSEARA